MPSARDLERGRVVTRRALMLGGLKAVMLSTLVGRMYYLQVVESGKYQLLADENRINIRLIPPQRGRILDRNGEPMAVNHQNFRVLAVREQSGGMEGLEATLSTLSKLIPVHERDLQRVLKEARRNRSFVPVMVRDNLSWDEMVRVQVNAPDLPGIVLDEGLSRHYPQGTLASHLIGYVAAVAEQDLNGDPLLELPGFRIGKAGMEKLHEVDLRGQAGTSQVEVNALGRVKRELSREEGRPGSDLILTLDSRLQRHAEEVLSHESAAAVLMHVHSGEVLAMASTPSYDPNAFSQGLSTAEWKALTSDPYAPLTNKAVGGLFAPGSTFKMVVALAALEAGVTTPAEEVYCPGHMELGKARFHCWKRHGHGKVDMVEALAESCDVYFYEMARRVEMDRIAEMANRLGLGVSLNLGVAGERAGLVPTPAWKIATIGERWHGGETLVAGIGQGYVNSTPLQLAVMTARLANGGARVEPILTRKAGAAEPRAFKPLGISRASLRPVLQGMIEVVNGKRGTARTSALKFPEIQMAGKTGTSQVRRITKAERQTGVIKNEDLPWEQRDHALFVGYAPVDAPRYALAVVVEHGGGGSKTAAPIAQSIMTRALELDPAFAPREARVEESPAAQAPAAPRARVPVPPRRDPA